jgi:hypothetical protein
MSDAGMDLLLLLLLVLLFRTKIGDVRGSKSKSTSKRLTHEY